MSSSWYFSGTMRDMANAWCQGRELSLITLVASLTQTWRLTPGVRLHSWNISSHDGESQALPCT